MRGRGLALVAAVAAGIAVLDAQPPATGSQQTFRTGTEVVFVDVSVREGGRPVTGLTPDDFTLTDNGVRQQVEGLDATAVPIDLTLVVDVSGNPVGPWTGRTPIAKVTAALDAEIAAVTQLLRPDDRLRVIAIERNVQLLIPFSSPSSLAPIRRVEFDGLSALYDTLATALLHPSQPARRHVVVARTKGRDTISSIGAQRVRAIAERSDALLHLVMMETAYDSDVVLQAFQCDAAWMGICWPTRRFWVPFERRLFNRVVENSAVFHPLTPEGEALAAGAEATGGGLHRTAVLNEPTLAGTFRKAFDDFRSSYVLRYTPQGVARGGWHEIDVKVRGPRSYTVRSRRGYGVDEAPAVVAPPAIPAEPKTLAELTLAYERGAYTATAVGLRNAENPARLIRDFGEQGNPWPAHPQREAAFALEVAEAGVFSSREETRKEAYALLERFSRLIRDPLEPTPFERYWHFAAVILLEGTLRAGAAEPFIDRALARFPDEPRFVLSRAIVADQRWTAAIASADAKEIEAAQTTADDVQRLYQDAIARPDTEAEARVRCAWLLHRLGRHTEAVAHLTEAGARAIPDPSVRYLRQFFLGHVLHALGRADEAANAYREAIREVPSAHSPRVALMNLMLILDDRPAAEALAEEIQTLPDHGVDPWWTYSMGQYRLHPAAMARVREMSR